MNILLFNNIYYFRNLFIDIILSNFLTLFASSYDVLACPTTMSDPSSNLGRVIQFNFIIIKGKLNL